MNICNNPCLEGTEEAEICIEAVHPHHKHPLRMLSTDRTRPWVWVPGAGGGRAE